MPPDPGDPLAPLRRDPARAGIFSDFDGTLSPIVAEPALAEPLSEIPGLLQQLARRYQIVAVVSGRPVAFLAARLPASTLLAGLYGLEVQHHGEYRVDPEAEGWRAVVSAATARLRPAAPSGVLVEPKGLSVTCHYRANPALEPQVTDLAQEVAAATGLVIRAGRKSVELLPPVHADKGTVIAQWASPLGAACYLGDDLGDLAAFRALDQLAARGIGTVRIAVRSDEAPAELLRAADVTVGAPEGAAALLRTLLLAARGQHVPPRRLSSRQNADHGWRQGAIQGIHQARRPATMTWARLRPAARAEASTRPAQNGRAADQDTAEDAY